MFDKSEWWRVLTYRERLILMVVMMELSQSPGTKAIDDKKVRKESCMNDNDYTEAVKSLFERELLDVDGVGEKLLLIGEAKKLFDEEVLKRRKQ